MIKEIVEEPLSVWLYGILRFKAAGDYQCIHLEEIGLTEERYTINEIDEIVDVLLSACKLCISDKNEYIPLIIFGLNDSLEMTFWSDGSWSECLDLVMYSSLYLIKKGGLFMVGGEEYRVDIQFALPGDKYKCFYRCRRGEDAAKHNWKFSRDICVLLNSDVKSL